MAHGHRFNVRIQLRLQTLGYNLKEISPSTEIYGKKWKAMKVYKNGVQKKKGQFSFYFLLSRVKSLIHGRRRKVLMSTPFIAPVLRQLSSEQTFLAQ